MGERKQLFINTHQVAAASRMVGDLSRTSLKMKGAGRSLFSTIKLKMQKKRRGVLSRLAGLWDICIV